MFSALTAEVTLPEFLSKPIKIVPKTVLCKLQPAKVQRSWTPDTAETPLNATRVQQQINREDIYKFCYNLKIEINNLEQKEHCKDMLSEMRLFFFRAIRSG